MARAKLQGSGLSKWPPDFTPSTSKCSFFFFLFRHVSHLRATYSMCADARVTQIAALQFIVPAPPSTSPRRCPRRRLLLFPARLARPRPRRQSRAPRPRLRRSACSLTSSAPTSASPSPSPNIDRKYSSSFAISAAAVPRRTARYRQRGPCSHRRLCASLGVRRRRRCPRAPTATTRSGATTITLAASAVSPRLALLLLLLLRRCRRALAASTAALVLLPPFDRRRLLQRRHLK